MHTRQRQVWPLLGGPPQGLSAYIRASGVLAKIRQRPDAPEEQAAASAWGHAAAPGAAQPVPYLVQGKGPDGVGRQLDCVQQRDLDHPVGFRTPARPVLVTLHLQGGEEKGSVLSWGLWGEKRMDVEKNHRATGPKHPSSPRPDLHSSCCKPAWQTAPIHPQGPSPPAPSSPCDSFPAHLLMPSSSCTIHSSAFATDSFGFLLSSPELPHLIWHPELPISSGTWLPPRGAAAPG